MDQDDMERAALEVADQMTAILNEVALAATIQASMTVSEGISLAFDNCEQEKHPLTFSQKTHIQHALMFVFREYEELIRQQISMIVTLQSMATAISPEDIIGEEN